MESNIQKAVNPETSKVNKVLIIGPIPPPFGGIATVIDSIINSELKRDFSFELFNRSESLYEAGTGSLRRQLKKIGRALSLFKKLWSGGYDFIHLHGSTSGFAGDTLVLIVAFLARTKALLHLHGTDWGRFYGNVSWFRRFYVRVGVSIPKRIVVLYNLWAENIRKIDSKINVRVIRNFIPDCSPPDAARVTALRQKLRIKPEEFVVSSIGRVGWRKGSFDIVEAASMPAIANSGLRILLVGGEENQGEMERLQKFVVEKGVAQWVNLIDEVHIEDVPLFLEMSDVFVLPSYYEGMPMSIIEAMRNGKPIISTKVGAMPDMIESGVSGILINPASPQEIAESIHMLRTNPELREKISSKARITFEDGFETSRVVSNLKKLYQEMLENES